MNTKETIFKIIEEQLGVEREELQLNTNILTDLGADSLDLIEMLMAIEEEISININDKELENVTTIESLINLIENKGDNNE